MVNAWRQTRNRLIATVTALGVGGAGAFAFVLIGFPAPFLTGPAIAATIAILAGLNLSIPAALRDSCFLILGIGIGSSVTPEVLTTAITWPAGFVVLAVSLLASLMACQGLLMRWAGYDRLTALLAATPGHLSYVLGLSTELKADLNRVAVVQSMRVLILTLLVPLLLTLWGVEGDAQLPPSGEMDFGPMAMLAALAVAVAALFRKIGVPAAWLLGGMVVSAVGHATQISPGLLPAWLSLLAFTIMGTLIGTRFRGQRWRDLVGNFGAGIGVTLVACALAAVGGVLAAHWLDLSVALLLISFAPGGVEIMVAMAVQIGVEPTFVAAHHVFRLIILTGLIPVLIARATRRT